MTMAETCRSRVLKKVIKRCYATLPGEASGQGPAPVEVYGRCWVTVPAAFVKSHWGIRDMCEAAVLPDKLC